MNKFGSQPHNIVQGQDTTTHPSGSFLPLPACSLIIRDLPRYSYPQSRNTYPHPSLCTVFTPEERPALSLRWPWGASGHRIVGCPSSRLAGRAEGAPSGHIPLWRHLGILTRITGIDEGRRLKTALKTAGLFSNRWADFPEESAEALSKAHRLCVWRWSIFMSTIKGLRVER